MSSTSVKVIIQENSAFVDRVRNLQGRSLNRLGTGNRWASASDDPTGIGLVEKMVAQNRRLEAAQINVQNATSLTQSMDGFLRGMSKLLTRMSELAQFSKDPTKNAADTALYATEFLSLQEQLRNTIGGSIAEVGGSGVTNPLGKFNGNELFGSNPSGTVILIGKNASDQMVIPQTNLRTGALQTVISQNASGAFTFTINDPAAVTTLTSTLDQISDAESTVGTSRARLDIIASRLVTEGEGLDKSISKIRDVDIAAETTRLAKFNMLNSTSTAMLSQASAAPKEILQLLRG